MKPSVLIVDDEETIRQLMLRWLEGSGYHVALASDGIQAMRAMRWLIFDVVLTDVMMPECDGVQVMAYAHATQPKAKVIATSGHCDHFDPTLSRRVASLSDSPTLPKPFTSAQLRALLAEATAGVCDECDSPSP